MRALRFLHARRMAFSLSLLGLLALVSGCGDPNPVASVDPAEAQAKGELQRKAREAAYGAGGVQKGKPAAPPPTK